MQAKQAKQILDRIDAEGIAFVEPDVTMESTDEGYRHVVGGKDRGVLTRGDASKVLRGYKADVEITYGGEAAEDAGEVAMEAEAEYVLVRIQGGEEERMGAYATLEAADAVAEDAYKSSPAKGAVTFQIRDASSGNVLRSKLPRRDVRKAKQEREQAVEQNKAKRAKQERERKATSGGSGKGKATFSLVVMTKAGDKVAKTVVNEEPRLLCKGDDPLDKQARAVAAENPGRVVRIINNKSGKTYEFTRKAKSAK